MAGGRRLPLQNGSHSLTSAIFVAWSLLLLYGPHGATGQTSCDDLWTIIVKPVGASCFYYDNGFTFIYQNLQEDKPIGQVYALTAQEGTTFTAFVPEGDPPTAIFEKYFSASLIGTNSISIDIVASLKDITDYAEDGNPIESSNQATSKMFKLTYANETGEQEPIVINYFQIIVIDVNNKPPEFEPESYLTSLREDWPLNIEIPDLKVKVKDRDGTGTITLSFDADCPMDTVGGAVITIKHGGYNEKTFQLKTKLDFGANPIVTCTLTANDGVNEGRTTITINVEEGQDKPPVFENSFYYIDVGNDDSAGKPLTVSPATIHAVDQDDPPTAITYRMENALAAVDGAEYFEINAASGEVTLIKELDDFLDQQRQLHFVLFAADDVGNEDKAFLEINLPMPKTTTPAPTTSTSTTLKPTTPASTTHTPSGPVFRKDTYLFQALKDMNSMGTVKATIDGQDSAEVEYSLEDDNFEIVPNTGEVRRKANAELLVTSYSLTVTAIVNGLTSDPTQVKIEVQKNLDQSLSILKSLHQVLKSEEQQGAIIGEVAYLPEKAATTFCVIYQDGVDRYEDIYFTFDNSKNLTLKENIQLDREREKQILVWVEIFNISESEEDYCPTIYKESGPEELRRSQSLFVIDVEDINDHIPTVVYPKSDITLAYPEDPALQKVVGPVIQLIATDLDDTDDVRYTLESDDEFAVDAESGAVFWEGDSLSTRCGNDGCSFTVSAEDKDKHVADPVKCKVVSLPADNIYTMSIPNMVLSDVEEELSLLSDELAMTVRALYVTPMPVASPARGRFTRYRNRHHGMRDGLGETLFDLEVHVSVMKDGEIVTLDNFNGELSKHDKTNAELFKDKDMYILNPDETPENVAGYQIALGVTGGLMGVLLLALVIMGIIRYRNRAEKRRGPEVPDLRRTSYSNQGYVKDGSKQHDTLDSNSLAMNGSVGGFHEPPRAGGDSPPLNKSQLGVTPDSSARGLRRTSPENVPNLGQPASREPPAQFKESTQQPQKETQIYTTAVSVGTAAAAPVAAKKQPAVEPALTQASTPYNTSSVSLPRKKKEPLPLTAEPKKSALKGAGGTTLTDSQKTKDPQIPLGSMAPSEPTADYETSPAKKAKTATSSFSTLKASPPPKKKEVPQAKVDEDDTDDGEDKSSSDVKKSNLKTTTDDSNDQDKKEDKERRKSSVAFKVLVEQKIIEPQNVGPAAKKQAKEEAKAEANQAAVDIMEANKKKLDDEDDEDGNSKL